MVGRRMVEKRCAKLAPTDEVHRQLSALLGIKTDASAFKSDPAANPASCSQANDSSIGSSNAISQHRVASEFSLSQLSFPTQAPISGESAGLGIHGTIQELWRLDSNLEPCEPHLTYGRAVRRAHEMMLFSSETSQEEREYFLQQLKMYVPGQNDFKPYSASTIKKYIQYVRKTVHPKLTPFASTLLQVYFTTWNYSISNSPQIYLCKINRAVFVYLTEIKLIYKKSCIFYKIKYNLPLQFNLNDFLYRLTIWSCACPSSLLSVIRAPDPLSRNGSTYAVSRATKAHSQSLHVNSSRSTGWLRPAPESRRVLLPQVTTPCKPSSSSTRGSATLPLRE